MMTKSRMLVAEAIADLDATLQERADIREHLRDNDVNGIYNESCARHVAEMMLEKIRDATAEDETEPKWQRAYYTMSGCKAVDCTRPAKWWMEVEAVPGIKFVICACNKHAGKEIEENADQ